MKTERIELEGGAWWEIKAVKTVGMTIASEKVAREYMKAKNVEDVALGKSKTLDFEWDLENIDFSAITRELVFSGTVAWSYGPVNREIFENEVPQNDYEIVARRCDELYGSSPLALTNKKD